jgi:hypothetical protein
LGRRSRDERDRAATRPLADTIRNAGRAAVALAAVLITMALPGSAFGAAKGIETDISWGGVSSSTQTQDANAMADLGTNWTRITMSWHDAEPSKGSISSTYLTQFDNAVNLAKWKGQNVIVDVYQSPSWASGTSDPDAPPSNPADYASFISRMAQRYGGQVYAWEIWNEENLGRFWGQSPNPGAYANMLKAAYQAVKSASGSTVLFGGMSTSDYDYLQGVYNAAPDIGNYFDGMAIHPYAPPYSPDLVRYDGSGHIAKDSFPAYREVRQVMLAHGNDKPLYFTEMGWSTTSQPGMGVSPDQQAAYTQLAWKCMQMDQYIKVGILYELRDNFWAGDANDWEDQLGLEYTNWSPKPAYAAFKSVDPGVGGCTYHTSDGRVLGSGTQLLPPAPAPAAPAPAKSTKAPAKAPTILLRVKTGSRPHSAGAARRLKTGVPFKVFGKVLGAKGGRMILTFQHRAHGKWRKGFVKRVSVTATGNFSTKQLKALAAGGWRVQGQYLAGQLPAKSRFVYFKA